MKTLLVYSPYSPLLGGSSNSIPLGLPSLSAYLKREKHEVSILDLNIKMYLDASEEAKMLWHEKNCYSWENRDLFLNEVLPKLQGIQEKWVDNILKSNSKVIGFYVSSSSQWIAISLAKKLKEKNDNIVIIFGGPECFRGNIEIFFQAGCVDAVVLGEGEATLLELVNSYELTGRIKHCPGALFMDNGKIMYGGPREPIKDLDTLPYPDFSDMIDGYKAIFGDKTLLTISWLRGCTHRCAFCCEGIFWGAPRPRSPESICQEFIFQKQKYNMAGFNKADSILAFSEEMLFKTCDLLIEKKVDVYWGSQARAEKYLIAESLQKMYQAGCRWLFYGIESGSQAVVDRMNKGFQVSTAENVVVNTKKAGMQPHLFIMVGSPGETIIDFMKTAFFIFRNRKSIYSIQVASGAVLPGTDWYLRPKKYGIVMDKEMIMKKRYYIFWRTKYFMDNRSIRAMKKNLMVKFWDFLNKKP